MTQKPVKKYALVTNNIIVLDVGGLQANATSIQLKLQVASNYRELRAN